jgi:tetratricopeptide (TPR) repeat protein
LENIGNVLNRSGLYSEGKKYFNQALALIPESEYSFDRMRGIMKSEEQEREDYLKLAKKGLSSLMEGTDVPIPVGGGSSDAT